ncbi:3-beta hydroxysteroid dehydrogenase/isomerase family protein [Enterococcus casseliflavus 14-MB-W-14]|uniref:sugar nucleotide-binding protein n=1 Tax=Enterococcus casseliflavus TaxID=37734 RepID=UPI00035284B8|nr:sugar nucleotide-binding protein [Enterococcus casseliflavus]EPH66793.1 3-beta hydroxysteroid dehydrogenase/isomerase family protein [Enterococcus casseliflavus 14-MB-W-14]
MKRILITGANSYIGTSFEKWMQQFGDNYQIDTVDMHGDRWKEKDFSQYDSVFHVAGIAHADVSKVSEETKQLYYKVNCDLAVETAEKYKSDLNGKNGQFIYMSSIIIYGEETNINKKRVITPETQPNPSNFYGDSKWKAEKKMTPLKSDTFRIAIIRPPMIYGEGSKGNYQQLVKIANLTPVFPNIKNERSMLNINRLCCFIKIRIDSCDSGVFFPQDPVLQRTSFMVKEIASSKGKKVYLFSGLNWFICLLGYFPGRIGRLVNKAFGSLIYDKELKRKDHENWNS